MQDPGPGMVPALGSPLHFRRGRLPRPRRRPGRRLGFDAGAAASPAPGAAPSGHPRAGRRAHAIQDFKTSVRSFPLLALPSSTPRLCQAPLACAMGYAHIESICLQKCAAVGIDCDIIGEIMDDIMYDIIDL